MSFQKLPSGVTGLREHNNKPTFAPRVRVKSSSRLKLNYCLESISLEAIQLSQGYMQFSKIMLYCKNN